jgi:hypothetical protein
MPTAGLPLLLAAFLFSSTPTVGPRRAAASLPLARVLAASLFS